MRLGVRLALLCGVAVLGYPPVLAADVLPTCTNEFDEEYGAGYCGARKENCAHPIFKDKCKRTCLGCRFCGENGVSVPGYQSGQRTVLQRMHHNRAAVCLHLAHIAALRASGPTRTLHDRKTSWESRHV